MDIQEPIADHFSQNNPYRWKRILAVWLVFISAIYSVQGQNPGLSPFPEAQSFLNREFKAVLKEIGPQDNLPDSVFQLPVQGDFVWSGLAVSLADYFPQSLPEEKNTLKEIILKGIRKDLGGETFAQLNILKATTAFGLPLEKNLLWESMTEKDREALRSCADAGRMYDSLKNEIKKGRPTNYLGVALQIAALGWKLGLKPDNKLAKHLLHQCISHLQQNDGWLNDGKPGEFRFDRYHFEFIRFVWEGAQILEDKEAIAKLEPWCQKSDDLWLALQNPVSGAPFPYGRSLQNTWEDVWEYTAWMHQRGISNRETRNRLHHMFRKSWRFYIRHEFDSVRHCSRMLDPGRACYSYVGQGRVWGYSIHALGKMQASLNQLQELGQSVQGPDTEEKPGEYYFPLKQDFGIWIGRSRTSRWVLPMVQGLGKPRNNDYQAIPYCEGRSEAPVNRLAEHLNPVWLHEGKRYYPEWKWSKRQNLGEIPKEMMVKAWVSKTDTIWVVAQKPAEGFIPQLSVSWVFDPIKNQMKLAYKLFAAPSAVLGKDSMEFGLWTPSSQNPYGRFNQPAIVEGLGMPFSNTSLSRTDPESKGPFTPFTQKRIWKWEMGRPGQKSGKRNLKDWTVDFRND
jgi:hypothetical protein